MRILIALSLALIAPAPLLSHGGGIAIEDVFNSEAESCSVRDATLPFSTDMPSPDVCEQLANAHLSRVRHLRKKAR